MIYVKDVILLKFFQVKEQNITFHLSTEAN